MLANPHTISQMGTTKLLGTFGLRYGLYVIMGGLSLEVSYLHNTVSQARLNTYGVIALAKQGHFFKVTPEAIAGKSKADILTKFLIVMQVSRMIFQCIARKTNGYP